MSERMTIKGYLKAASNFLLFIFSPVISTIINRVYYKDKPEPCRTSVDPTDFPIINLESRDE